MCKFGMVLDGIRCLFSSIIYNLVYFFLQKVPEESQLVYRAPAASLECSCFINDSEFLSGSDDGSLELWGIMRKKPSHIVKNAHPIAPSTNNQNIPVENGTKEATQGNFQQLCCQIIYIIFVLGPEKFFVFGS